MAQLDVMKKLQAEGWHLKSEPLDALVQELADDSQPSSSSSAPGPSYSELHAALLDCDLRKYGAGCLPEDVNRAGSSSIKGPMVLQVMSVSDVSKPSYATSGSGRLLALRLTDGRTACKAAEMRHCSNITDTLIPGSKVVLTAGRVRCGVVLLEPGSVQVLGGRVDSLAEAWETQKRYGGTNRPGLAAASGSAAGSGVGPAAPGEAAAARLTAGAATSAAITPDDGASAPRFKQFVPGRDGRRNQQQTGAAAAPGTGSSNKGAATSKGLAAAAAGPSAVAAVLAAATESKSDSKHSSKESVKRTVDITPVRLIDAATAAQQSAAQAKLLDKLERSQAEAADRRGRGRGGFRGRRGRRRGGDSDDDEGGGGMTLEEYEARQKSMKAGGALGAAPGTLVGNSAIADAGPQRVLAHDDEQMRRDEELARQLQAQLNLEEAGYAAEQQQQQQSHGHHRGGGAGGRYGGGGRGAARVPFGQYGSRAEQPHQHQQRRVNQGGGGVDYTEAMFDQFDYGHGGGRGQQEQRYASSGAGGHSAGGYTGSTGRGSRGGSSYRGDGTGRGGRGRSRGRGRY